MCPSCTQILLTFFFSFLTTLHHILYILYHIFVNAHWYSWIAQYQYFSFLMFFSSADKSPPESLQLSTPLHRSPYSVCSNYKLYTKAAHSHFWRYTDVRVKGVWQCVCVFCMCLVCPSLYWHGCARVLKNTHTHTLLHARMCTHTRTHTHTHMHTQPPILTKRAGVLWSHILCFLM